MTNQIQHITKFIYVCINIYKIHLKMTLYPISIDTPCRRCLCPQGHVSYLLCVYVCL